FAITAALSLNAFAASASSSDSMRERVSFETEKPTDRMRASSPSSPTSLDSACTSRELSDASAWTCQPVIVRSVLPSAVRDSACTGFDPGPARLDSMPGTLRALASKALIRSSASRLALASSALCRSTRMTTFISSFGTSRDTSAETPSNGGLPGSSAARAGFPIDSAATVATAARRPRSRMGRSMGCSLFRARWIRAAADARWRQAGLVATLGRVGRDVGDAGQVPGHHLADRIDIEASRLVARVVVHVDGPVPSATIDHHQSVRLHRPQHMVLAVAELHRLQVDVG